MVLIEQSRQPPRSTAEVDRQGRDGPTITLTRRRRFWTLGSFGSNCPACSAQGPAQPWSGRRVPTGGFGWKERMGEMQLIGLRATLGALRATSLVLRPGLNVIYGQNGAGKSTLLSALRMGLRDASPSGPSRGEVVAHFANANKSRRYDDVPGFDTEHPPHRHPPALNQGHHRVEWFRRQWRPMRSCDRVGPISANGLARLRSWGCGEVPGSWGARVPWRAHAQTGSARSLWIHPDRGTTSMVH